MSAKPTSIESLVDANGAVPISAASPLSTTLGAETTKVIGTVNIAASQTVGIGAGTEEIGNVKNSGTFAVQTTMGALTPKFALANVTASQTDVNVVTAVAAKKIRVLSWILYAGGTATNVTFNSKPAGAGTAISPLFALGANNGAGMGFSPVGHFETVAGEGLTVTTGAGATTGIAVTYVEV